MLRWPKLGGLALVVAIVVPAAGARAADPVFIGSCDASGAVPLGSHRFVVADDEQNVLRSYDADRGGVALATSDDLSAALGLAPKKNGWPEMDLEAATGLGTTALWLSSHGRTSTGKAEPSRLRFFGTRLDGEGSRVVLVGRPYAGLLDDLLAAPSLAGLGLREAAARAPKEPGGLNIEGMTARPDGVSVVIGFRNPVPSGRALAVVLENPLAVLEGASARFGPPVLLDLGGLGVRAISRWRGWYWLVAGPPFGPGPTRLYRWDGVAAPQPVPVDLGDFNAEAFVTFEDRAEFLLLSDEGSRLVDGTPCKRLPDPARKSFRGRWVRPPPAAMARSSEGRRSAPRPPRGAGAPPPADVGPPWHP